ncbi:MAG: helix-turn-helix domain-containing protein [Ruminococcaceae bacterium]|nr:helix-turn-helix domain-containing protein [Oscillospiraceae bacterium]
MEDFLLNKLAAVSREEEAILSGRDLDRNIYSQDSDFVVDADRVLSGGRSIAVRTHTQYIDFPIHKHNYLEMMIVLSGSITHVIADEAVTLEKGDILVLNKHVSHSIKRAGTDDIGVNVIISDNFIESLMPELSDTVFSELARQNSMPSGSGIYLAFSSIGNKQIENIVENLLFELTEYTADDKILRYTTALLFDYLSRKSKKLLKLASRTPDKNGMRRREILGYIQGNFRSASLSELSKKMFLTPPYLSKIINEIFGKGFKELLLEERIRRAAELVIKTDLSIGNIIESVGYENESYFHREFKKHMGYTPLKLRKLSKTTV